MPGPKQEKTCRPISSLTLGKRSLPLLKTACTDPKDIITDISVFKLKVNFFDLFIYYFFIQKINLTIGEKVKVLSKQQE